MNYKSIKELNQTILNNIEKIPSNIELIVGIPRSGMLAASIISLHKNLPLTDLHGYINNRTFTSGARLQGKKIVKNINKIKALVIDDSIYSGNAITNAKKIINNAKKNQYVKYACIYAAPEAVSKTDIYFEICQMPRVFEWNIMHHSTLRSACVDIDGVLCRDPTNQENDDGPLYKTFINSTLARFVPSFKIGCVVTSRLEKYRNETQDWLNKNNIIYDKLEMLNLPNKEARLKSGCHAHFKAEVYRNDKYNLFIESSEWQSKIILKECKKPVFCFETRQMLQPNTLNLLVKHWQKEGICYFFHPRTIVRRGKNLLKKYISF